AKPSRSAGRRAAGDAVQEYMRAVSFHALGGTTVKPVPRLKAVQGRVCYDILTDIFSTVLPTQGILHHWRRDSDL
ncbi:MAG: hypothetical protein ACREAC_05190, partial [Blastocatellia bacterium]